MCLVQRKHPFSVAKTQVLIAGLLLAALGQIAIAFTGHSFIALAVAHNQ